MNLRRYILGNVRFRVPQEPRKYTKYFRGFNITIDFTDDGVIDKGTADILIKALKEIEQHELSIRFGEHKEKQVCS